MTAHDPYRDNLSLYAVGALASEESELLERHLQKCSSCREELRILTEAAGQIAMAVGPTTPPAHLRGRLLARLRDERSRQRTPLHGSQGRWRTYRAWFWAPAFASAILFIGFATVWTHERELVRENRELTTRLKADDSAVRRARELISTLTAGDAQQVTLVSTAAKPQPEAKAVYSPQQRDLVLLAGNLNPLPVHKTYQLWLLPANGAQPMPAGTFKPDARGSAALVLSQFGGGVPAKGFAVTIEDEPGSAVPTMPIVLSGTP
jgi:anti-sigma-K factor RskA